MSRSDDDGWMVTFTGKRVWPLDPVADDIDIRDIAHHLARICRWGGAVKGYYSVAEHSVHLVEWFVQGEANDGVLGRWALLHDASEAYLGDVIRPLKQQLPGYKEIETRLEHVIWQRYGLEGRMPDAVKRADTAILHDERRKLFAEGNIERMQRWAGETGLGVRSRMGWSPDQAEHAFLEWFNWLFPAHKEEAAP